MIEFKESEHKHFRKTINERFFSVWSEEMAWCLGLLYTDGNLSIKRDLSDGIREMRVKLSSTDLEILDKYKKFISFDGHIYEFDDKRGDRKRVYEVCSYNRLLCNDLISLGLNEKKSLNLRFPGAHPEIWMPGFIRGLWDGDGGIYIDNSKYFCKFTSCSKSFIIGLSDYLYSKLDIVSGVYDSGKGISIQLYGDNARRFSSYIYHNNMGDAYLDRKYQVWLKYKKMKGL